MSQKQQKKLRRMAKRMASENEVEEKQVLKICKDAYKQVRKSGNKGRL